MNNLSNKNPWHDLCSSLTAMKLGLKMLTELPEIKNQNSTELATTLRQLTEKCNLSIEQVKLLRGEENDS